MIRRHKLAQSVCRARLDADFGLIGDGANFRKLAFPSGRALVQTASAHRATASRVSDADARIAQYDMQRFQDTNEFDCLVLDKVYRHFVNDYGIVDPARRAVMQLLDFKDDLT